MLKVAIPDGTERKTCSQPRGHTDWSGKKQNVPRVGQGLLQVLTHIER